MIVFVLPFIKPELFVLLYVKSMNIHSYLRFRAEEEGHDFAIPVGWFTHWMALGCRTFFCCTVDSEGCVLSDYKNPTCLQRFWFNTFQDIHGVLK